MKAIFVLVGLLVLSYAGSLFSGRRTIHGAGLPSSVEYAVLGFVLGPHMLGIIGRDLITTFEPVAQIAVGWLALVIGLDFGRNADSRVAYKNMALGLVNGALTGVVVGGAVWLACRRLPGAPTGVERVLLAGGLGAACSETTRHAIRWAMERHGAKGKLTSALADFAHADDVVPLLGMAVLFSIAPGAPASVRLPAAVWVAITIGLGTLLGALTTLHIGREARVDHTWGVMFGTSMLGLGIAARAGLSLLTVLFFMGWSTAVFSRHRAPLRAMVVPVERPVLLPALVLAGAHVDFPAPRLLLIIAVAVTARILAKLAFGAMIALPAHASPWLGTGLLSSGAFSMSVGLIFAIRFPGPVGDLVLASAFVTCIVGEAVGPLALRRALVLAGEIVEPAVPSESAASQPGSAS
jgi:hypothetical protein